MKITPHHIPTHCTQHYTHILTWECLDPPEGRCSRVADSVCWGCAALLPCRDRCSGRRKPCADRDLFIAYSSGMLWLCSASPAMGSVSSLLL
jgi:hypothetical protein